MYPVGIPENEILVLNMSGQVKGTRLVVEVKSRANVLRVLDLQSPTLLQVPIRSFTAWQNRCLQPK